MQQVIINLYSNAIKFTNKEGNITIMIENIDDEYCNPIIVSVADSGVGIQKEDRHKLFRLFGSIKDEKEGVNL